METISTLTDLATMVRDSHERGVELFVRTSTGIANDRAMGCSRNHQTGQHEGGISVTSLTPHIEALGVGGHDVLAMQVKSWAHVAPVTYILTGEIVGNGSDGEPVLDPATWEAVAIVDADAIAAESAGQCKHPAYKVQGGYCYQCMAQIA